MDKAANSIKTPKQPRQCVMPGVEGGGSSRDGREAFVGLMLGCGGGVANSKQQVKPTRSVLDV